MLKTAFLASLMTFVLLVAMAYAGPEVTVVNTPDNPAQVAVVGETAVNVVGEPGTPRDVNITNSSGNPVPVTMTGPSSNNMAIKGIARADGEVAAPNIMSWYEVINLSGPGTFIESGINSIGAPTGDMVVEVIIDGNSIIGGWPADLPGSQWPWEDKKLDFGYPVSFESSLVIRVQPTSVYFSKILVSVIYAE